MASWMGAWLGVFRWCGTNLVFIGLRKSAVGYGKGIQELFIEVVVFLCLRACPRETETPGATQGTCLQRGSGGAALAPRCSSYCFRRPTELTLSLGQAGTDGAALGGAWGEPSLLSRGHRSCGVCRCRRLPLLSAGSVLRQRHDLSCVAALPGARPAWIRLFAKLSCLLTWLRLVPAVYFAWYPLWAGTGRPSKGRQQGQAGQDSSSCLRCHQQTETSLLPSVLPAGCWVLEQSPSVFKRRGRLTRQQQPFKMIMPDKYVV